MGNHKLFLIFILICAAAHIIRLVYELLKHKNLITPGKLSFIIIFINMAALWISWFALCSMDPSANYLPAFINYSGLLIIFTGIILFLTALFTIKTLETYSGDLMTKGIYSFIRHPMYLGFIFLLIGLPFFYGGIYSLILAAPFIVNVLIWRYLEELELIKRFPDYTLYKKHTIF